MNNQKLDENKINFVSEEAKEIFCLSLENESLEKENQQLKEQIEEKDRIITNAINFIYKNTNKTMSEEEFMLELLEVLSKEKSDK